MGANQLAELFSDFLRSYDAEAKDALWQQQSKVFREFWATRIMVSGYGELPDSEIDDVVRILDRYGKGNTKSSEAVARAMIPQGAWRRMFNELKNNPKLSQLVNGALTAQDAVTQASNIDQLYKANANNKNNLTGKSGNAICVMLAAWKPSENLSVISLNDRRRIMDRLQLGEAATKTATIGTDIVASNDRIIDGLSALAIRGSARTISVFLYTPAVKPLWKPNEDTAQSGADVPPGGATEAVAGGTDSEPSDPGLFYLEEELENFLIRNWDQTELGKKYDLIDEDGEMVSQQYSTPIGPIDILAQDKKSKQYVVIELKRDQTSDQTVGQLARYMGWLEESKTNGKVTKGIIIAGKYDKKLYYALKKLRDAEVYLYKVDFKLNEFKEG
jgi:hypothetical protein